MNKIRFGIAGSGWRAEFYIRIAHMCGDRFELAGVTTRNTEKKARLEKDWGLNVFNTPEDLIKEQKPDFIVSSVPWDASPDVLAFCAEAEMPVLSETPPAPDIETLVQVNELASAGAKIQVAEQYHLQPHHAARLQAVKQDLLGTISQAQVSTAHGYHGISIMRRLLGIKFENCSISGRKFISPLTKGSGRSGPPDKEEIIESAQQLAQFEFDGKLGIFDFTGDQYFSWIRSERILVRGEKGEIVNKHISYLRDYLTPIELNFERRSAGADGNLEGKYLKGYQLGSEWVYKNPFTPAPLTDDEIAVASCLSGMAEFVETGKDFYSLAEASQDHYLSLMMDQAIETGETVTTETMPWGV